MLTELRLCQKQPNTLSNVKDKYWQYGKPSGQVSVASHYQTSLVSISHRCLLCPPSAFTLLCYPFSFHWFSLLTFPTLVHFLNYPIHSGGSVAQLYAQKHRNACTCAHTQLWQILLDICYDWADWAISYRRQCWERGGTQTCNNTSTIEFQSARHGVCERICHFDHTSSRHHSRGHRWEDSVLLHCKTLSYCRAAPDPRGGLCFC